MLSKHGVGTYQGNKLTYNSLGNARAQSSQLAEPLWTGPGLKSGVGVRELISTKTTTTPLKHEHCVRLVITRNVPM